MNTLIELRKRSGLTLREVEAATGVSNAYLSQLENGKIKKPSAQCLYCLARLYSVNIESILIASGLITEKDIQPVQLKESLEEQIEKLKDRVRRLEFMLTQNA